MKQGLIFIAVIFATPAFAHHEVVATGSLLPLAVGLAAITAAWLTAWRQQRKMKKARLNVPAKKLRYFGSISTGK